MHDSSESLLRSIPIFADLSRSQLRKISAELQLQRCQAGEDILARGQPAQGLLILLSGTALLFHGDDEGSPETVTAESHLWQEALFDELEAPASLRAATEALLAHLPRSRFRRLLSRDRKLREALGLEAAWARAQVNPRYADKREHEALLLHAHRHWWSFARSSWLPLLLMLLMWLGAYLVNSPLLSVAIAVLSIALPGAALVYFFAEWRNDALIVTDQRVIYVERTILAMQRKITQVGLESVQEINFDIPPYDPFARIFRYGTLIIKTAGAQGNLRLDLIPKPQQYQKLIIEDRQRLESRRAQRHQDMVRAELQRWMEGEPMDEDDPAAADERPPQPLPGSNGYLSARIVMSNGDIVYRKHISVWAQHTFLPILLALAGLTALLLTFTLIQADLRALTFPVSMIALLLGGVSYYWLDWDWRNDIYIVSDDTITLVRKRPFFLQNLRDQILVERIDNVESASAGLFANLMRYGDVRMSLIGADDFKLFHRVADPLAVQQEISRRQHNKAERRARLDARQQRQIIGEALEATGAHSLARSPDPPPARPQPEPPASAPMESGENDRPPGLPGRLQAQPPRRADHEPGVEREELQSR